MPVCAAVGGPVSAAVETTSPPHCPRLTLGCQAWFRPPVGSATRSNRRGALPHLIAPRVAPKESTGAATLCPCHGCLSPPHPRTGALPIAALLEVSSCAAPATGPLRSFLPPCKRSYCNARGLLRQGPASWRAPQLDGHRGLAASTGHRAGQASLDAGGPQSQALRVTGDRRRAHVPDAAQAWAGGQRGGKRAPTPLAGRCAPWLDERSFTDRAVCCRVASRASAPAQAASGPAGEAGGRSALPCVP